MLVDDVVLISQRGIKLKQKLLQMGDPYTYVVSAVTSIELTAEARRRPSLHAYDGWLLSLTNKSATICIRRVFFQSSMFVYRCVT